MTELLAHDVAGAGSAVLLHSGVANRRTWQPQWDALAPRHRVIRCDFRAYGGAVALELASVAPQRVSQLVLLCPAGDVEPTADIEEFAQAERELSD